MAVHPTLQRLLNRLYATGFGQLHQLSLEEMRQYLRHPKLKVTKAPYQDFKTELGLSLRCYHPSQSKATYHPAIIFLSASAYVIDRVEASDDYCSLLANTSGMKVIHIVQRLAPENRFPRYIYDTFAAIQWIYHHCHTLQIFQDKIALWGESSGGSIAASVTHLLRDEGLNFIQKLILIYPMVDMVHSYPSRNAYQYGYMLDKTFIEWLYTHVSCHQNDRANPLASPLLSTNFNYLPSTTLISAEYDPLRDEGLAYVNKLQAAGVSAKEKRYPGMIHGFMRFYGKIDNAQVALHFACDQIKACFC